LLDARNLDTQQGCAGAATAASYIEAFPDLQVSVDHFHVAGDSAFWVWTLTGTNNGPGGTGKKVRVSGIEAWRIGPSGLAAYSRAGRGICRRDRGDDDHRHLLVLTTFHRLRTAVDKLDDLFRETVSSCGADVVQAAVGKVNSNRPSRLTGLSGWR
jgi:hypothetical protein